MMKAKEPLLFLEDRMWTEREKERVKRMWRKECEGDREEYEEETGWGGDSQTIFDFNSSDWL